MADKKFSDAQLRVAAYGTWESPLTAKSVTSPDPVGDCENILVDPVTSEVYFVVKRPFQNGRSVIVSASNGHDMFGSDWDARTGVHEYGGGAAVANDSLIYFSHIADGRVYKCAENSAPEPVTPNYPAWRYACFTVHPKNPHFIVCTREDHTNPHPAEVKNTLCLIDVRNSSVTTLIKGADFYAYATFSPDGKWIAWQQWYHPDPPWQSAEIALTSCHISSDGNQLHVGNTIRVAGEHGKISALEPHWTSNEQLIFISDISGFLNPWKFEFDSSSSHSGAHHGIASAILPHPIQEEFGETQWELNIRCSAALTTNRAVFVSFRENKARLYLAEIEKEVLREIPTDYVNIDLLHNDGKGGAIMLCRYADSTPIIVQLTFAKNSESDTALTPKFSLIGKIESDCMLIAKSFISAAEHIVLELEPDKRPCYIEYYAPKNPQYTKPLNELPPAVVWVHGGPHFAEHKALNWMKQYFTTRGWAWVDVNYGGSSAFGKKYRESLDTKWGILDVQDICESITQLHKLNLLDSNRSVVHGASAGGYTTLCISVSKPHAFAAGVPWFGISDMHKLDEIVHKFEYYLCDRLMGAKYEDIPQVWVERSPIYHARKIKMPLLILQGEIDTVVPAEQMKNMAKTINEAGGQARIIIFEGEGHGWRKAESMERTLEELLHFWRDVFGLKEDKVF